MSGRISGEFIERTKYRHLSPSAQSRRLAQPPLETPLKEALVVLDLPNPLDVKVDSILLRDAIEKRVSIRDYWDNGLSIEELSWLLWATQGVKQVMGDSITLRNVPSAGARHAFDTYLLINRVHDTEPGLYRYLALDHKLALLNRDKDIADRIMNSCLRQNMVANSAVTFIWAADFYRMSWRYGERGLRYIYIDAGHVCQNLYLAAEAINSGVCAIGAYEDDIINEILGLDGENQFTVYVATLGKRV